MFSRILAAATLVAGVCFGSSRAIAALTADDASFLAVAPGATGVSITEIEDLLAASADDVPQTSIPIDLGAHTVLLQGPSSLSLAFTDIRLGGVNADAIVVGHVYFRPTVEPDEASFNSILPSISRTAAFRTLPGAGIFEYQAAPTSIDRSSVPLLHLETADFAAPATDSLLNQDEAPLPSGARTSRQLLVRVSTLVLGVAFIAGILALAAALLRRFDILPKPAMGKNMP